MEYAHWICTILLQHLAGIRCTFLEGFHLVLLNKNISVIKYYKKTHGKIKCPLIGFQADQNSSTTGMESAEKDIIINMVKFY